MIESSPRDDGEILERSSRIVIEASGRRTMNSIEELSIKLLVYSSMGEAST